VGVDDQDQDDELVEEEEMRPTTTGLFCFINSDRACGAECMGYTTYPKRAETSELSDQQAHCALLNNADRVGRNMVIATSILASGERKKRLSEADKQRASQFDPSKQAQQSPFGDKKP
jgi:hypothetical protein